MKTKLNKLQEIDNINPFKVPENYFAQFNKEIMNKLPEREPLLPVNVSLWSRVKPWIYLAAMFIGISFTINWMLNVKNRSIERAESVANKQIAAEISISDNYWSTVHITEEEFYQYLEEQLIDDRHFDYIYDHYYLN